jgi:catabolite regulation protein CreA
MKECVAVKTDFKYEEAGLKKVMLLAAVMAMVMAAAVPALAQTMTQAGDGSIACVQTAVQQNNVVGNNIVNDNAQAIAQECNISVTQVNTAVSKYLDVNKGKVVKYQYSSATASASAKAPAAVQYKYKYSAPAAAQYEYKYSAPAAVQYQYSSASAAPAALPSTGGASLIALGAGVLLVAGGLLARRIVR